MFPDLLQSRMVLALVFRRRGVDRSSAQKNRTTVLTPGLSACMAPGWNEPGHVRPLLLPPRFIQPAGQSREKRAVTSTIYRQCPSPPPTPGRPGARNTMTPSRSALRKGKDPLLGRLPRGADLRRRSVEEPTPTRARMASSSLSYSSPISFLPRSVRKQSSRRRGGLVGKLLPRRAEAGAVRVPVKIEYPSRLPTARGCRNEHD